MLMLALLFRPRSRALLALALAAAFGSACGEDKDPEAGVLVVPYELGNRRTCDDVDVKIVRAELDDPMFVEETLCGNAGEIRFPEVPPGSYHVRLFGVDSSGFAVMDSLQSGEVPVSVVGRGTTVVADPAIKLTAAPAHLLLRWGFGFGTCESSGIARFAITAWRSDGSALLLDTHVDCEMPGEGAEQYRGVPDLERELAGNEVGEVNVQPLDKNDTPIGEASLFNFDAPGAGRYVKLSLSCDAGGCSGSGVPD
jgi:hypothetical protein